MSLIFIDVSIYCYWVSDSNDNLVVNVHSVKPNKKEVQISEFSEWRTSVEKQHTIECYYPDEKNLLKTLKKSKVKIDKMCDICSIKIDPYSKTLNETKNIRKDQDNNETFINPISFKLVKTTFY